jgi:hypothetical protein
LTLPEAEEAGRVDGQRERVENGRSETTWADERWRERRSR